MTTETKDAASKLLLSVLQGPHVTDIISKELNVILEVLKLI